jgi:hypothetical protein
MVFSVGASLNFLSRPEVGIIDLGLSPQQVSLLPISHRPQNLVVQQPSRVVLHAQVAAELQRGDPSLGLADQVKGQKPGGQWQLGGLHDCAGRERGLMDAVATLITLKPPAIDQSMLLTIAAGSAEPIGPARLLQSSLTLLIDAIEPLELRQGEAFLELDRAMGHGRTGICIPLYGSKVRADSKSQQASGWGCRRAIASSAVMSCITACNPARIERNPARRNRFMAAVRSVAITPAPLPR